VTFVEKKPSRLLLPRHFAAVDFLIGFLLEPDSLGPASMKMGLTLTPSRFSTYLAALRTLSVRSFEKSWSKHLTRYSLKSYRILARPVDACTFSHRAAESHQGT
jgi:hypothetical protein